MRWFWGNLLFVSTLALAIGCDGRANFTADGGAPGDARSSSDAPVGGDGAPACDPQAGPALDVGWIGGPCTTAADCGYAAAVCLTEAEGFPGGLCTLECVDVCPDPTGPDVTPALCVAGVGSLAGSGMCVPQCDWAQSPATGCRSCWGCFRSTRFRDPGTVANTCGPGAVLTAPMEGPCYDEARRRGLDFAPAASPDEHPPDHPLMTCSFDAPLRLVSPIRGIHFYDSTGSESSMPMDCSLALAIDDAAAELAAQGVVAVHHLETYRCELLNHSGIIELTEHAFGKALDFVAFRTADGTTYTVADDWQSPWLQDVASAWWDDQIFNIIVGPGYGLDMDLLIMEDLHDRIHADLTTRKRVLGM
jgi:hypothetical protein